MSGNYFGHYPCSRCLACAVRKSDFHDVAVSMLRGKRRADENRENRDGLGFVGSFNIGGGGGGGMILGNASLLKP